MYRGKNECIEEDVKGLCYAIINFALVDYKYYQLFDIAYKTTKPVTNSQESIRYLGMSCFKMKLWP